MVCLFLGMRNENDESFPLCMFTLQKDLCMFTLQKLNQIIGMEMMGSTKFRNEKWKSHFLRGWRENEIRIPWSDFLTPSKI